MKFITILPSYQISFFFNHGHQSNRGESIDYYISECLYDVRTPKVRLLVLIMNAINIGVDVHRLNADVFEIVQSMRASHLSCGTHVYPTIEYTS